MPAAGPALVDIDPTSDPLERGLKTKPDDLALASAKTQMSWRQLDEISTRLAVQYSTWRSVWNLATVSHR